MKNLIVRISGLLMVLTLILAVGVFPVLPVFADIFNIGDIFVQHIIILTFIAENVNKFLQKKSVCGKIQWNLYQKDVFE